GRPRSREVRELCDRFDLTCHRFRNSPLAEWLPLLLSTERIWEHGSPELVRRFNELLNRRTFRAFLRGPAYRSVYMAFKSPAQCRHAENIWGETGATEAKHAVDPVRLLSRSFTRLLSENKRRAIDASRLALLERERVELHHRLQEAERRSVWQERELNNLRRFSARC